MFLERENIAFVRTKEIPPGSGNHYRYLVESRREGSHVRQKVLQYLGTAGGPSDKSISAEEVPDDVDDVKGLGGSEERKDGLTDKEIQKMYIESVGKPKTKRTKYGKKEVGATEDYTKRKIDLFGRELAAKKAIKDMGRVWNDRDKAEKYAKKHFGKSYREIKEEVNEEIHG